jgi:hypothetical protein
MPEKNLYGAILGDGQWIGLDAESVKNSHETDHQTGLPIPPEEGVHYKAFPITRFLNSNIRRSVSK